MRAIVLTGAGRGFCAGADMSLLQDVVDHGVHPLPEASDNRAADARTRADFQRQYARPGVHVLPWFENFRSATERFTQRSAS